MSARIIFPCVGYILLLVRNLRNGTRRAMIYSFINGDISRSRLIILARANDSPLTVIVLINRTLIFRPLIFISIPSTFPVITFLRRDYIVADREHGEAIDSARREPRIYAKKLFKKRSITFEISGSKQRYV